MKPDFSELATNAPTSLFGIALVKMIRFHACVMSSGDIALRVSASNSALASFCASSGFFAIQSVSSAWACAIFFARSWWSLQESHARHQHCGRRLRLLDDHLAAGFAFQPRDPRLDRPGRIEFFRLEERELVRVLCREHLGVAAELGDAEAAVDQPRAAGDILRVAELRCGDLFAPEIGGRLQIFVRLHHQRRPAVRRPGNDADLRPLRLRVGIQRRPRPDVGEIDRPRKDRLHRARPRIVGKPLDFHVRPEPLLKPPLPLPRKIMRDQRLCMRDIRKMPETDHRLVRRRGLFRRKQHSANKKQ